MSAKVRSSVVSERGDFCTICPSVRSNELNSSTKEGYSSRKAAPGGGYAISIKEATKEELKGMKKLPTVCQ